MQRTLLRAAALAASLAVALAAPQANAADKPGVDAFFNAMAIDAAPGQQARFVVGDNLAGYFEGYTHNATRGAGYVMKQGTVLQGYASGIDGAVNERATGREQVLPYGHRVTYANGASEEMALLSKQQAIAVRVTSKRAAALSVGALLAADVMAAALGQITRVGDVNVVQAGAQYLAIAADQPVNGDGLALTSAAPTRALTVVMAFGASAAQAASRARALAHADTVARERKARYEALTRSYLATSDAAYNKALNWAKASSGMFVVEEFGAGIWAGLPWFRDNWGRDTFIALPGTLLVSGQFAQAKAVLANFARYQNLREPRDAEYGRIPNRIASPESVNTAGIIYNTVDGTPWMLREALEYIRYTGDTAFAAQMYKLALPYFDGAIANYVDSAGLLTHDSADTWMDARIDGKQPWSARGPRAVEIQALWYTALQTGATLADQAGDHARALEWRALAAKAQASFLSLYWDGTRMADRLRDDASADFKVRPNQLMLVSIPSDQFVPLPVQAKVTRNAVSALLYPYGIASLSEDDPYFHPRHENPGYHHKDAAYHQGTIWGWNAGFTVTALNKFGYQDLAWQLTRNLGDQILGLGTLGAMSELLDALPDDRGQPKPSGTFAQSWSVAEYARNGYQDYVGFKPDLLAGTLALAPAIPAAWTSFSALLPFGTGEELAIDFARAGARQRWRLRLHGTRARTLAFTYFNADKSRAQASFTLAPGRTVTLVMGAGGVRVNGKRLASVAVQPSFAGEIGTLGFRTPKVYRTEDFPMLKGRDVLKGIVERNEYR
jgi:glycogen debranching enzyme